jgi:hypothetical protein
MSGAAALDRILQDRVTPAGGSCRECSAPIPGVWNAEPCAVEPATSTPGWMPEDP